MSRFESNRKIYPEYSQKEALLVQDHNTVSVMMVVRQNTVVYYLEYGYLKDRLVFSGMSRCVHLWITDIFHDWVSSETALSATAMFVGEEVRS